MVRELVDGDEILLELRMTDGTVRAERTYFGGLSYDESDGRVRLTVYLELDDRSTEDHAIADVVAIRHVRGADDAG